MAKNKRITDLEAKIKRIKDPELQKQLQDELNDLKGSEGFEDDGDDEKAKLKEEIASLKSQLEEKQKTAQEKAEDDYAEELLERYSDYKRQ